jgi:hypothetical protein
MVAEAGAMPDIATAAAASTDMKTFLSFMATLLGLTHLRP